MDPAKNPNANHFELANLLAKCRSHSIPTRILGPPRRVRAGTRIFRPQLVQCGASGSRHSLPRTAGAQPGKAGHPAVQNPRRWRWLRTDCGRRIGSRIHPPCRHQMNRDEDLMNPTSLPEPRASLFAAGNHLHGVRRLRPASSDRLPGMACRDSPLAAALRNTAGSRRGAGQRVQGWQSHCICPARRTCRNHRILARRDHGPGEEGPSGGCREAHGIVGGGMAGSERWRRTCAAAGKPRQQSSTT